MAKELNIKGNVFVTSADASMLNLSRSNNAGVEITLTNTDGDLANISALSTKALEFRTSGSVTPAMCLDNNQNVFIPNGDLRIDRSSGQANLYLDGATNERSNLYFSCNGTVKWQFLSEGPSDNRFRFYNASATQDAMVMDTGSKVCVPNGDFIVGSNCITLFTSGTAKFCSTNPRIDLIDNNTTTDISARIYFCNSAGGACGLIGYNGRDDLEISNIYPNGCIFFCSSGVEAFHIDQNGEVCGSMRFAENQFCPSAAIELRNSDITGINTLFFNDDGEGMCYPGGERWALRDGCCSYFESTQAIGIEGGSFCNGTNTCTNAAIVINSGDHIFFADTGTGLAGNIRTLIAFPGSSKIQIGQGGTSVINCICLHPGSSGTVRVEGTLSKAAGSFQIDHPLPHMSASHDLVHSFVEAPKADLIYRGTTQLLCGSACVNIDDHYGMTTGTFNALVDQTDIDVFTQNLSGWTPTRGYVSQSSVFIESQDTSSIDCVSWLIIGDRCDPFMITSPMTDDTGKFIIEPLKVTGSNEPIVEE